MKTSKTKCLLCAKEYVDLNISTHRNEDLNAKFGFCKSCMKLKVERDGTPLDALRMLNIPFIEKLWNDIRENNDDIISAYTTYLKAIAPKRNYKDFHSSEFLHLDREITIDDEIIDKWGIGLSDEEYIELESMYNNFRRIKEPVTPLEQNMYKQQALIEKRLKNAIENGTASDIDKMMKTYNSGLKNLGLDISPVDKSEIESLGQRIQKWESEEPIPEVDKSLVDVDNIEKYIKKYFLIPMKRVWGKASNEEIEYLYSDDFEDKD